MLKIKKIENKIEVKDVAGQSDICKHYWEDDKLVGMLDCLYDCSAPDHPGSYASRLY